MYRLTLITAMCMLFLFSIAVHGAVIHYEQNFDNLKDGEAEQDGWATGPPATVNENPTTITSEVFHGDSGKSMKVDPMQVVVRDFDPIIKSGVHFLSLWFRYELQNITDDKLFIYMGEEIKEWAGGPVCYIGGGSDPNKVTVYNGGTGTPVGENIIVGEWQHFFEVINVDNQTCSVYVDDVLVAENFGWRNPGNHKGLGWLMLGFDRGIATIGYYDDIVFGEGNVFFQSVAPGDKLASSWGYLKSGQ